MTELVRAAAVSVGLILLLVLVALLAPRPDPVADAVEPAAPATTS